MVIPWIKAGLVALNVSTSATLGGVASYYLFGKAEKGQDGKDAEAIKLELEEAERKFEAENTAAEERNQAKIKELEGQIAVLRKVESCLWRMKDNYDRQIKELGWWRIFKLVTYSGKYCNESSV